MSVERIAEAAVADRVEALAAALRARLPDVEVETAEGEVRLEGRGLARRMIEDTGLRELIR